MKYLIDFKSTVTQAEIDAYLLEHDCAIVKQYENYDEVYLVSCDTAPMVTDIVEYVIEDDGEPLQLLAVDYAVAPNVEEGRIAVHEERDWWKVASLRSPSFDDEIDTYPIFGHNVVVYMMDSGIDSTHPEFDGADITNLFSFTGEFSDTNGHGTAISSVIVGKTCGMTNASLKVVKVFDKNVETKQSDLLAAFDAIISDHETDPRAVKIINMSWGIPKNSFIEAKIAKLIMSGVQAVAAAGNDGTEIGDVTPASMPEVITVGSYNQDFLPSNFSNYTGQSAISVTDGAVNGGELDGWAPGENIYSATVGGGYGMAFGTSMATAIHVGSIAYNISDFIRSDGSFGPGDSEIAYHVGVSGFFRRNMMHLDDPKYSASKNFVTTYKTHSEDVITSIENRLRVKVGESFAVNVAKTVAVSKITADADLPAGFTLDNGILSGQIDSITGDYEFFEFDFTLTLRDGGEVPFNAKFWIVSENFDDTAPDVDPELKITPFAVQGSCSADAYGNCTSSTCFNGCRNCGDKDYPACTCLDQECR